MNNKGFTLLELLVTLVVVALLLAIALPSFTQHTRRARLLTETDTFQQGIVLTRTQAIGLNRRVTMAHRGDWTAGWDIFIDSNHNGQVDSGETILLSQHTPLKASIKSTTPVNSYVSFTGSGQSQLATGRNSGAFQAGTFTLCMDNMNSTQLIMSRGGRVRLIKESSETC